MEDKTESPGAQRWWALAADSYAVAETLTDADAKATMRKIALGYEHMAVQAGKREAPPIVVQNTEPEPGTA